MSKDKDGPTWQGYLFCGTAEVHAPHIHHDGEGNAYECEGWDLEPWTEAVSDDAGD